MKAPPEKLWWGFLSVELPIVAIMLNENLSTNTLRVLLIGRGAFLYLNIFHKHKQFD
jgi:hypothetical protein